VMSQTHLAGGALFTAAGLGAATAAGWMHPPAWALALGVAWGALAARVSQFIGRRLPMLVGFALFPRVWGRGPDLGEIGRR